MAVSGKSIIHYTRTLDNLKGILTQSGFRLKYCLEDIYITDKGKNQSAFPMVCFCDLPLTHAKEHIDHYGSYGIGLSKTWARENKLNPVLYLERGSSIAQALYTLTANISRRRKEKNPDELTHIELERLALVRTLAFSKPHMGQLFRNGELVNENYVFYDEREWRYVPDVKTLDGKHKLSMTGDNYTPHKDVLNSAISSILLNFNYTDISYILVDSQADILPTIKCLQEKYVDELTQPKIQELCTRIVTKQQIINDF